MSRIQGFLFLWKQPFDPPLQRPLITLKTIIFLAG
jgi:hypothetical protein